MLNSVLIIAEPIGIEGFKEFPPVIWLDSGKDANCGSLMPQSMLLATVSFVLDCYFQNTRKLMGSGGACL